jgi:hypothetical protein
MADDDENRPLQILTAFLALFPEHSTRELDATAAFQQLAAEVPDLEFDELAEAADYTKAIASEMKSLRHRFEQAMGHEQRLKR